MKKLFTNKSPLRWLIAVGVVLLLFKGTSCDPFKKSKPKLTGPFSIAVVNGDFEAINVPTGWQFYTNDAGMVEGAIAAGVGRDGSRGAMLEAKPDSQHQSILQQLVLPENSRLVLSAWASADGPDVNAKILIECLDNHDASEENQYGQLAYVESAMVRGGTPWARLEVKVTVPPGTDVVQIRGFAEGTNGTVYFDDFSFDLIPSSAPH
jgi:hypothetical protein